jgi:hypothetical protein
MKLPIKYQLSEKRIQVIKIKDLTKNKYGLPTSLAMERMLNK